MQHPVKFLIAHEVIRQRSVLGPEFQGGGSLLSLSRQVKGLMMHPLRVSGGEGFGPNRNGVITPRLDLDVVRRIRVDQLHGSTVHEPVDIFPPAAIAAKQTMVSEYPQVAGLGYS